MTRQSDYGRLERVLLKHARDAFRDPATVAREWRELGFTAEPDYDEIRQALSGLGG